MRGTQYTAGALALKIRSIAVWVFLLFSAMQVSEAQGGANKFSVTMSSGDIGSSGTTAPSPTEILDRLRTSTKHIYINLAHFDCKERIERYRGNARGPRGHKIDMITSQISYDQATEQYADIRQNGKRLSRMSALSGAWSQGEYGTILQETIKALDSRAIKFVSFSILDGTRVAVFSFDYGAADSPWDISIDGGHYSVAFLCQVWASAATGDLMRIERIAHDVPPPTGISAVNWAAAFGPIPVGGAILRLPDKAIYSVSYSDSRRHDWNVIAFSGYKRRETTFPRGWTDVSHHDLEILGDIDEDRSLKLMSQLEGTHRVLELLMRANVQKPVRVYAFRSPDEYNICRPNPWSIAFTLTLPTSHYIVLGPEAGDQTPIHEYVHAIMHDTFPHLPFWLDEGIADYYSTIELNRDFVRVGAPPKGSLEFLERFGLPLDLVTLMKQKSVSNEHMAQGVYAESWLLVHMLHREAEYGSRFNEFVVRLAEGQDPEQLFHQLWNRSLESVEGDLYHYLYAHHISTDRITLPNLRGTDDSPSSIVERDDWQASYRELLVALEPHWHDLPPLYAPTFVSVLPQ